MTTDNLLKRIISYSKMYYAAKKRSLYVKEVKNVLQHFILRQKRILDPFL